MNEPKRIPKKTIVIALSAMGAIAIIGVLVTIGWYKAMLRPVSLSDTKVMFTIQQGESGQSIADGLKKAGLIRSQFAFRLYAKKHGVAAKFAEGTYYLPPSMSVPRLIDALQKGEADIKITTIEGWRNEQIAELLLDKMKVTPADFLKVAKQGYMFPDTYLFNKKEVAGDIVGTMQANFDAKVTRDLQAKIKAQRLTLDQGVTLASIVEREARDSVPNERQIIASILLKRYRLGMPLQADATVQYALGFSPFQKKWWRELSTEELKTQSAYNTYLKPGLPPGPICNPGLASITAVADASDTPYLYYLHDKDGVAHFAKTLEDHTTNQQRYIH